jgi:hypothetical protein
MVVVQVVRMRKTVVVRCAVVGSKQMGRGSGVATEGGVLVSLDLGGGVGQHVDVHGCGASVAVVATAVTVVVVDVRVRRRDIR